jgi:hypothetical protein
MPIAWTAEKIAAKSNDEIKILRENAIKHGAHDVLTLCDEELLKRVPPPKSARTVQSKRNRRNTPVIGYHFVCRPEEKGVTRNSDGTAWSGTWVVSETQVEKSLSVGAYVALHLSHAEPSYLHGNIKAWRRSRREAEYAEGQEVKTPVGTDFLLELTGERLPWRGEGTVERSYVYETKVDDVE